MATSDVRLRSDDQINNDVTFELEWDPKIASSAFLLNTFF